MRDEEFDNLYFQPKCPLDKTKEEEKDRSCSAASGTENAFTSEEKRALGITTHRTEDNIKIDHEGTVRWIGLHPYGPG